MKERINPRPIQDSVSEKAPVLYAQAAVRTAQMLAADIGYTALRGLVFALDLYQLLSGLIDWDDMRWDPTDEDVRGRYPRLDAFRDRSYDHFHEARAAVHRRRILRQQESLRHTQK